MALWVSRFKRLAAALPAVLPGMLVLMAASALLQPVALAATKRAAPKADSADLRELRSRIESLKNDIASKEESRNEARDALRESERAISEANRELRGLVVERQNARNELARLGAEARGIESELGSRQDAIGHMLTLRYFGGDVDYLKLMVSGQDPNQTARDLHYYSYVSRAQAALIRTLRANLARLRELEDETRDKTEELAEIEAEQKKERDRIAREQTSRKKVLEKVSAQIREQRKQVKSLERDENRLTRLVAELGRVIADQSSKARSAAQSKRRADKDKVPPAGGGAASNTPAVSAADGAAELAGAAFAKLKGSLRLPIRGELLGRFGKPRSGGGPSWKGLFIRATSGQEVRAVARGRVVFAEWMRGFGNLLILDHGEGYLTIYGNNEAVLKQVGEIVKAGDAVATTGSSGGSVESGLYFEIRHEGQPFDPMKWVASK